MVTLALAALVLASSHPTFPIPSEKGKPAPSPEAKAFHLDQPLGRLEGIYRTEFKGDSEISFLRGKDEKGGTLTIINASKHDRWTKAVLRGNDIATTIQVTQVLELPPGEVQGTVPIVSFFVPRSSVVEEQLQQIDADDAPGH